MTAHTPSPIATTITRHLGRLLCGHLALALTATATLATLGVHTHRAALYALWAVFPLTAAAWALARAAEKRHLRSERNARSADPTDWTSAA